MRQESGTCVVTAEALNGLWHTSCHDPLDLLHQHEEQSLLRPTSAKLGNLDLDVMLCIVWI